MHQMQMLCKTIYRFCYLKEAQELGQQVGSYQFLTNKNAKNPEKLLTRYWELS